MQHVYQQDEWALPRSLQNRKCSVLIPITQLSAAHYRLVSFINLPSLMSVICRPQVRSPEALVNIVAVGQIL
jgi:hypothetical protein